MSKTMNAAPSKSLRLFRLIAGINPDAFYVEYGSDYFPSLRAFCELAGFDPESEIFATVRNGLACALRGQATDCQIAPFGLSKEQVQAMRMMLAEDFIENDTAQAAAALFFIVATGHFSEFLAAVKAMDEVGDMPICWQTLECCLLDLLSMPAVFDDGCYPAEAVEKLAALSLKLPGVDHV